MVLGHRGFNFTLIGLFSVVLRLPVSDGYRNQHRYCYQIAIPLPHCNQFGAQRVWSVVARLELSTHSDVPRVSQLSYRTAGCIFRVPAGVIFPFTDRVATCS
jgi:hypothetical protein